MNVKIEVKIKMKNGKEVTLNSDEAQELFLKLKELYDRPQIVTVPVIERPYYPSPYQPWITWQTSDKTASLFYYADNQQCGSLQS